MAWSALNAKLFFLLINIHKAFAKPALLLFEALSFLLPYQTPKNI
jgi:fructose-specific component phosphotransferase system IIB-like protein